MFGKSKLVVAIVARSPGSCAWAALDQKRVVVESGWLDVPSGVDAEAEHAALGTAAADLARRLGVGQGTAIAVHGPRAPLPAPRPCYWDGKRRRWRNRRKSDRGLGRHCEVVLQALGIGDPIWCRPLADSDDGALRSYRLFAALAELGEVHEVYVPASYRMLRGEVDPRITVGLGHLDSDPRAMLDAWVAAFTLHEFLDGRGVAIGGGDGLGVIALPRTLRVPSDHPVLRWPERTEPAAPAT